MFKYPHIVKHGGYLQCIDGKLNNIDSFSDFPFVNYVLTCRIKIDQLKCMVCLVIIHSLFVYNNLFLLEYSYERIN